MARIAPNALPTARTVTRAFAITQIMPPSLMETALTIIWNAKKAAGSATRLNVLNARMITHTSLVGLLAWSSAHQTQLLHSQRLPGLHVLIKPAAVN
jgi:hypothetical protein